MWEEPGQAGQVRAAGTGGLPPQTPPASRVCLCQGGPPLRIPWERLPRPQAGHTQPLPPAGPSPSQEPPPQPPYSPCPEESLASLPLDSLSKTSWLCVRGLGTFLPPALRSQGPMSSRGCAHSVDGTRSWHSGLRGLRAVCPALCCTKTATWQAQRRPPLLQRQVLPSRGPHGGARWDQTIHSACPSCYDWAFSTPGPGRDLGTLPCPSTVRPRPDHQHLPPHLTPPTSAPWEECLLTPLPGKLLFILQNPFQHLRTE